MEDKAFLLKLQNLVKATLDETIFRRVIDELERAAEIPITGHVKEVVELTCREYGMNETERECTLEIPYLRRRIVTLRPEQCCNAGKSGLGEL